MMMQLMKVVGYQFENELLLSQAMTHRSAGSSNNERLEFLGDSILGMVIAQALYHKFPKAAEGQLSRLRSTLVRGKTLAELASKMDLGSFLKLGTGELKSGGYRRESILADAMEAVIGAVFLDSNLETVQALILQWYAPYLARLTLDDVGKDSKTKLQEFLQARKCELPDYQVISTEGKAHNQVFHVSCRVDLLETACYGRGSSRRKAEQEAARQMLAKLLDQVG